MPVICGRLLCWLLWNFPFSSQSHLHLLLTSDPHLQSPQHKSSPHPLTRVSLQPCQTFVCSLPLSLPRTATFHLCLAEQRNLLSTATPVISPLRGTFLEPSNQVSVFFFMCLLWTCLPTTLLRAISMVITNFMLFPLWDVVYLPHCCSS